MEPSRAHSKDEKEAATCFLQKLIDEASRDDFAANDVLIHLHSGVAGFRDRSRDDVVAALVDIMRRRNQFITNAAQQYARTTIWDEKQWKDWYTNVPLGNWLMDKAAKM